jgi:hypothetical protein
LVAFLDGFINRIAIYFSIVKYAREPSTGNTQANSKRLFTTDNTQWCFIQKLQDSRMRLPIKL